MFTRKFWFWKQIGFALMLVLVLASVLTGAASATEITQPLSDSTITASAIDDSVFGASALPLGGCAGSWVQLTYRADVYIGWDVGVINNAHVTIGRHWVDMYNAYSGVYAGRRYVYLGWAGVAYC